MTKESKQLLIGLPKTGKSTFLAALWHQIESSELAQSLRLHKLWGDREYLNAIRNRWLGCEEMDRTPVSFDEIVTLCLKQVSSNKIIEIAIPDLGGEVFDTQWEQRLWSTSYASIVDDMDGLLLFVHPDELTEPTTISIANEVLSDFHGNDDVKPEPTPDEYREWQPSSAPTQVKLVELLQFIHIHKPAKSMLRVGVVISAWDLVEHENIDPGKWLSKRLPLLSQYLRSDRSRIAYQVFGVSAQGGQLGPNNDALRSKFPQSERVVVIKKNLLSHDLTTPISWLIKD